MGYTKAANQGALHSRGEFLCFLNSDTWVINFNALGFAATDIATSFAIRAINPNPADTGSGTKEHFLISGFLATIGRSTCPPAAALPRISAPSIRR